VRMSRLVFDSREVLYKSFSVKRINLSQNWEESRTRKSDDLDMPVSKRLLIHYFHNPSLNILASSSSKVLPFLAGWFDMQIPLIQMDVVIKKPTGWNTFDRLGSFS